MFSVLSEPSSGQELLKSFIMWFVIVVVIIVLSIYLWFKKQFRYFEELGFPYVPG